MRSVDRQWPIFNGVHNKSMTGCFHCAEFMPMDAWLEHMAWHCVNCVECRRIWAKWLEIKSADIGPWKDEA